MRRVCEESPGIRDKGEGKKGKKIGEAENIKAEEKGRSEDREKERGTEIKNKNRRGEREQELRKRKNMLTAERGRANERSAVIGKGGKGQDVRIEEDNREQDKYEENQ